MEGTVGPKSVGHLLHSRGVLVIPYIPRYFIIHAYACLRGTNFTIERHQLHCYHLTASHKHSLNHDPAVKTPRIINIKVNTTASQQFNHHRHQKDRQALRISISHLEEPDTPPLPPRRHLPPPPPTLPNHAPSIPNVSWAL